MAWCTGFGNAANFVSANMFIKTERPRYPSGISVGLSFCCIGFALVSFITALLVRLNKRRDTKLGSLSEEERAVRADKGFKFVL
jgi:hypothetical protein